MPVLTKSTQTAADRLKALIDRDIMQALQPCIDEATAPLQQEIEAHRNLVNDTVEKARLDNEAAIKALSDKENELIGARARIKELENENDQLSQGVNERDARITELSAKVKAFEDQVNAKTEARKNA